MEAGSSRCHRGAVGNAIRLRRLDRSELARVAEIDRAERIDVLYVQEGEHLVERGGRWDSPSWEAHGDGPHSVGAKVRELQGYADLGGVALGALVDGRIVGIGVVVPHVQPGIAHLAFLHVSAPWRAAGVGTSVSAQLEEIARSAGDTEMVVSATPSGNTVRFYLGRGFVPTAEPLAELVELEPEDVHMRKAL